VVDEIVGEPKVELLQDTVVDEIVGREVVSKLRLRNVMTEERSLLDVAGVFISIGLRPNTDFAKGLLSLDESGHIPTNGRMETKTPGIFAAGDVRHDSARQAITAAGDGATAAVYAERFISQYE
jgi:thioredoxin reductase (NADPH)